MTTLFIVLAFFGIFTALVVALYFIYQNWDVKREVKGYPKIAMLSCDKHGLLRVGSETITLDIPMVDGGKQEMCLYCYDTASKTVDAQLKAAKEKIEKDGVPQ